MYPLKNKNLNNIEDCNQDVILKKGAVALWFDHLTAVQKVRVSKSDYEI